MDIDICNLKRFKFNAIGVYFLFADDELIYIGESINIMYRVWGHRNRIFYNNFSFVECSSKKEAKELEREMIIKYHPKLNIIYNISDCKSIIALALQKVEEYQQIENIKRREFFTEKKRLRLQEAKKDLLIFEALKDMPNDKIYREGSLRIAI